VQQARHLGAQKGWYILSGGRRDINEEKIPRGSYKLVTLEKPYPGFNLDRRRTNFDKKDFEKLKKEYNYRCATCGSKEGEPHYHWPNTITTLQPGHMDPNKPLELGNIIPQCAKCNRPDRNRWIYDNKGRVISIANPNVIDTCSDEVQKAIYKILYLKFGGKNPNEL
jgi:predicted restriction endonuclease